MEIAYYQDRFLDSVNELAIPIQERGHQFGDGVYEVVRVYNGKPFMLIEHLDRFHQSANAILLKTPYSKEEIISIIEEGIDRTGEKDVDVYFQLTRGIAPRLHLFPNIPAVFSMVIRPSRELDPNKKQFGVPVLLLEDERWVNCYIKSLNLLPNLLAKQHAHNNQCEEAILIKDGLITEGSSSNIFAISGGTLYTTPATKRILHGITRRAVFQLAVDLKIPLKEESFTPDFLKNADEAFITSTTAEILPINKVDHYDLPGENPITKKLQAAFKDLC
jgi:D-alanine transaminase